MSNAPSGVRFSHRIETNWSVVVGMGIRMSSPGSFKYVSVTNVVGRIMSNVVASVWYEDRTNSVVMKSTEIGKIEGNLK